MWDNNYEIAADLENSIPFSQNLPIIENVFQAVAYEDSVLTFNREWKMRAVIRWEIEFNSNSMVDYG